MGAAELYEQTVRRMPSSERLRLASLILNDLVPLDDATEWTQEDLADATLATLTRLDREAGEGDA